MAGDERSRKAVGGVILAVLSPLILGVLIIMCVLSGAAGHDNEAVRLCFYGGDISSQVPAEYTEQIQKMRDSFSNLDLAVTAINRKSDGAKLDVLHVKSVFYSLYFGQNGGDSISSQAARDFVSCFVRYEKRSHTGSGKDGAKKNEIHTVAVPITDFNLVCANLEKLLGRSITDQEKSNSEEIYQKMSGTTGTDASGASGASVSQSPSTKGMISPIGSSWRSIVTSEFGGRVDPINGSYSYHKGLDLGVPTGTPVRAAKDGTVLKTAYNAGGYGYYVMINHGGEIVTLYGHCSRILTSVGHPVKAGDIVALSGSTGRSTGSHLHFEVRVNGKAVNPRGYLP